MEKLIAVECWSDYYFFGKLLQNRQLVRKEKNKAAVIKGVLARGINEFAIGIVDSDDEKIDNYIKGFEIDFKEVICNEVEIIKIKNQSTFIIQLSPKDFEKWIVKFIEAKKNLNDFGYNNQKELDRDSKVILAKVESNQKLKELFNFVLIECTKDDNHILKLKKVINYLLENKHNVDLNKLINV